MTINDLDSQEVLLSAGVDGLAITIPNAGSVSQAIDLKGFQLKGIVLPSAWTAAALSLKVSADGVTFVPWSSSNNSAETSLLAAIVGGNYVQPTTPGGTFQWNIPRFIKLVSGTNGTPVAQGAARVFSLVLTPDPLRVQV